MVYFRQMSSPQEVTRLLKQWADGVDSALDAGPAVCENRLLRELTGDKGDGT